MPKKKERRARETCVSPSLASFFCASLLVPAKQATAIGIDRGQ